MAATTRKDTSMSAYARRVIAVLILTAALLGATVGTATATFPGRNGQITFMRFDANGEFQVWVANPDMSHQIQLTHGPGSDAWFPVVARWNANRVLEPPI